MSGSDCGHVFIWNKASGAVQAVLKVRAVPCLWAVPCPLPLHASAAPLVAAATVGAEAPVKLGILNGALGWRVADQLPLALAGCCRVTMTR